MPIRRLTPASSGVLLAVIMLGLTLAAADVASARIDQQKGAEQKTSKAQVQETQALVKLVNDVAFGAPAPSDFPVNWQNHYIKARDQRTFVPYVLSMPQGGLTNPSVAMYIRVVRNEAEVPPAAPTDPKAAKDAKAAPRQEYAFEGVVFTELKTPEGKEPYRLMRALSVLPGEYTVYAVVRERPAADKKNAAPGKTSLVKESITVPDYWQPGLTTSSIIVADKVELLNAAVPESQLIENPYDFGRTRVIPAAASRKFSKKEDLSVIFYVYNTAEANKKPDVAVEYNFVQKTEGSEKYFNKTDPQLYNAETLPPAFDMAAGHQIVAGQSVPLASFPEGDYRLEIKVTDKIAGKSIVQSVNFTVTP
jgi:hypothetical protein